VCQNEGSALRAEISLYSKSFSVFPLSPSGRNDERDTAFVRHDKAF